MIKLEITGMTCNHCVKAVTKALEDVAGAERVQVSLERREAIVDGNPDPAALVAAVEEEGYGAKEQRA